MSLFRFVPTVAFALIAFPSYSVQITDDGKAAIHRFSSGDMRVAINLLQVC